MKTKSITMTPQEIASLKKRYEGIPMRYDVQYTQFQIKGSDFTITAYKSGKVVFQAEDLSIHIPIAHQGEPTALSKVKKKSKPSTNPRLTNYDRAGSDEVGTGDYFGPVVVCAAYVSKEDLAVLPLNDIGDTKSRRDELILKIAPIIMNIIKYDVQILSNAEYNQLQKTYNKNAIVAKMHNKAYLALDKKIHLPDLNVIDDFTDGKEYLYYDRYLKDEDEVFTKLYFETEAEDKYYAVACGAIIARYKFLISIKKMQEHYNFTFPLGASSAVDTSAKEFVKLYGADALINVTKYHFSNTKRILNIE